MPIRVEIDRHSGFCGGVIRAIDRVEEFLDNKQNTKLFSLGAIVHNDAELDRLGKKGLVTIDKEDLNEIPSAKGETLLIRAHGEPPETYMTAGKLGFEVIDCTCPVVLRLQKRIKKAYLRLHSDGKNGQIIIFGRIGHAEVLGLLGHVDGDAVVVESKQMLLDKIEDGTIKLTEPIEIFSQTTKSPIEYSELCSFLEEKMPKGMLTVNNTVCGQVASRHSKLSEFAVSHDVVVFVAGKISSNGRVLCELCRSLNIRTYYISSLDEIKKEWFRKDDNVGVCGATSTPQWLLEEVANKILEYN